jgi:hypothetical protein
MNKHKENNRARRICAKLKNLFHTIKSYEERIAAVQFNDELDAEEKATLVGRLQSAQKLFHAQKNTLEKRQKELAYTDVDPIPSFRNGATHFAPETVTVPDERNQTRTVQVSRRECKCTRAFFALAEAYAAI